MDRKLQTEAANAAIHKALSEIIAAGHDMQDVSNVLFAYSLKMMIEHNGQPGVARHLKMVGRRLSDPRAKPFSGPPFMH